MACIIFCIFVFGVAPLTSRADDIYTFVVQKQEQKQKSHWTLSDWLETRDTMRLQDLWFALHTPTPYEYYLGGSYQFNQTDGGVNYNAWNVYLAAYASIFGLEARLESGLDTRWTGLFNLRVFGYHSQSTNITLQLGVRNISTSGYSLNSALAGVSLTFYVSRYFGLEGVVQYYFPSTPNATGVTNSGDWYQGGAFLDFSAIRVYVDYFKDWETLFNNSGIMVGTRVYF